MYCRNCGNPMDVDRLVCGRCGSPRGAGSSFCPACGARQEKDGENCSACGCGLKIHPISVGKSRRVAGIAGILLGSLGVHNFYLGYRGKAWGQLLITALSLGTLGFISGIWGLVEGLFYLTGRRNCDAAGIPLRD